MDAILSLETIVVFYSYTRYKVLHMGRMYKTHISGSIECYARGYLQRHSSCSG
jgi:hypothetical protein